MRRIDHLAGHIAIVFMLLAFQVCTAVELTRQPVGLEPGEQYRLIFTTAEGRPATSKDIDVYNDFVQSTADAAPVVGAWGLEWKVIASTAAVDARDNTRTNPLVEGVGVPLYRVDGERIMRDYEDMWGEIEFGVDGSTTTNLTGMFITELGTVAEPILENDFDGALVFTGTSDNGTAARSALGERESVVAGNTLGTSTSAFFDTSAFSKLSHLYYAISEMLTVPHPGDVNGDGNTDFDDFTILADNFGERGPLSIGEVDGNGIVDFADFLILASNFGSTGSEIRNVPEPNGFGLGLLLGTVVSLFRRHNETGSQAA